MRSRRSTRALVLLAGLSAVAGGAAASALAGASASPSQLYSSALRAARTQRSVHYVSRQSFPSRGVAVTMVGDAGAGSGVQRITYRRSGRTGHVTVRVVAGSAYIRGDAFALESYMGFPSAAAAQRSGRWLRLPSTAPGYKTVAAGVRFASTLAEIGPKRPSATLARTVLHGRPVVGIRGTSTVSGQPVTDTLYVRAAGRPLPVAETARMGRDGFSVTFSRWNEPVRVAAPTSTVTLAS